LTLYLLNVLHHVCFTAALTTIIFTLSLHELFRSRASAIIHPSPENAPSNSAAMRTEKPVEIPRDNPVTMPGKAPGKRTFQSVLRDRKSTRLNSSHVKTSYAVFCLTKKIALLTCYL